MAGLTLPYEPASTAMRRGYHGPSAGPTGFRDSRSATGTAQGTGYGAYTDPAEAQNAISAMPEVIAAQLAQTSQGGQADDSLRQTLQRLLIGYGDTGLAKGLGMAVDPATQQLVDANTLAGHSTLAQAGHDNAQARASIVAALTGRGLAHSGQLALGIKNQEYDASQAANTAAMTVQQQLSQAQGQNTATHQNLTDALTGAVAKATSTMQHDPTSYPLSGPQTVGMGAPAAPPPPAAPTRIAVPSHVGSPPMKTASPFKINAAAVTRNAI